MSLAHGLSTDIWRDEAGEQDFTPDNKIVLHSWVKYDKLLNMDCLMIELKTILFRLTDADLFRRSISVFTLIGQRSTHGEKGNGCPKTLLFPLKVCFSACPNKLHKGCVND